MACEPYIRTLRIALALACLSGCVEKYVPTVANVPGNYLVVNGFINSQGVTTIQLSRSLQLSDTKAPTPEVRATVFIQASTGQRFALTETPINSGTYISAPLGLDPSSSYQLRLTTAAGHTYASDPSPVKNAPPIDAVHWRYENEGVQVYADAHDATSKTTYYRWAIQQTWLFTTPYEAILEYSPKLHKVVLSKHDIYHCWLSNNTSPILQTNTARLSQDVVKDFPLIFLPASSEQLRFKYSVLVQLLAQSKDEYDYLETLKKNTESIGTINDPLPTQLTGNVHNLADASEPVLGYVGVHSVSEQRIFIARLDVPQLKNVISQTGYDNTCSSISDKLPGPSQDYTGIFSDTTYFRVYGYDIDTNSPNPTIKGYLGSTVKCVDCRLRGTNVKPVFWK
jgi:hypothetical protein